MKKFVASYSGGKDSALAIYKALQAGHQLVGLLTTYHTQKERSWFHGIPQALLSQIGAKMGVPHRLIQTAGADYTERFEAALSQWQAEGADSCVFGDIDIQEHRDWVTKRCENTGLTALLPLWGQEREALVREFVDVGFIAHITVVDTTRMAATYVGKQLSHALVDALVAEGVDACGEKGEYHSFVSDGPLFTAPVPFVLGHSIVENGYAIAPVEAVR